MTTGGSEAVLFADADADEIFGARPMYANYMGFTMLGNNVRRCRPGSRRVTTSPRLAELSRRRRRRSCCATRRTHGRGLQPEEVERIIALACEHDLFVIADGSESSSMTVRRAQRLTRSLRTRGGRRQPLKRFSLCGARMCLVSKNRGSGRNDKFAQAH